MWYGARKQEFLALTNLAIATRQRKIPCVSPENGYFLTQMVRVRGALRVLEIGTATGVSTLYLQKGMGAEGAIDTLERQASAAAEARENFARFGDAARIRLFEGDALTLLREEPMLAGPYDLVFIDAMKREYGEYVEAVRGRLAPGGVILCDDVIAFGDKMTSLWALMEEGDLPGTIIPTDPEDGILLLTPEV